MQSHVGVADATAQAYARKFVALADTAHAALVTIWPEGDSPIDPLGPPLTVDISQIVHQGGNANSAYYPVGGNNLPNKNRFRNPKAARPQRFVIFPHISRYRAQNQGLPVAREICAPAFARRIEAALTNRHAAGLSSMAHETMHSDGIDPYIPRAIHGVSGEMSLEDYYAGLAAKYEEGSADLLGMLMLRVAEQEGVIDRKTRNDTVVIKLANMLRNFFLNDEKHYGFASRRYWQLFLKHGIFTLEGDGKYHFHMARLWARLDDVIREYMDEYGSRDKDRVFAARDKHMRAFSQSAMAAAVRRVSARIPLYDRPQYRVQGYTPGLVAPDLAV
jgi:hypothetical protein